MAAFRVTTDPACGGMIPPFVRTGRVKGWSIAASSIIKFFDFNFNIAY
jgi:hypothetical protein